MFLYARLANANRLWSEEIKQGLDLNGTMVDRPLLASEMSSIWCIEDAHPITKFEMSDSESARFDGVVVYEAERQWVHIAASNRRRFVY